MTDREMLQAAAKAVGLEYNGVWFDEQTGLLVWEPPKDYESRGWNPLADDGDALRLAGKLRIQIEHMKTLNGDDFGVNCWPSGRGDCGVSEDGDLSDYMASMRRAIVRAAAGLADAPGAA